MAYPAPPRPHLGLGGKRYAPPQPVWARARVSLWDSRPLHALLALAYLAFYWSVYTDYLSVVWSYAGLIYRPLSIWEQAFAAVGVAAVGFALPTQLRRPSALILWLLFAFVYVPTIAQTFMIGERPAGAYLSALGALTVAMVAICWIAQRPQIGSDQPTVPPSQTLVYGLLLTLVVVGLALLVIYRDILTLADISNSDDVYAARFAAADVTSGLLGYVRTYFSYVLGPGVLAVALSLPRYRWMIVPSLASFLINYMIDGSKISLVIPLAAGVLFVVLTWARFSVLVLTGAIAVLTVVSGILANHSPLLRFISDLILFRSVAIPGQQFALYYDLFSARGFTWWSNVRGISFIVPPPAGFASDPRWPALGQIVGEEYYGISSRMNSNANPFAGEGVAAAGPLGVVVIALVLAVCLRILDRAAVGWDRVFVIMVMVPVGMALTNVHLSTMLLSYGGAFWMLAFTFLRPGSPATQGRRS